MDRYFNGETARIHVVLLNGSQAGITAAAGSITLWVTRVSDGWFWNGTEFTSSPSTLTVTETDPTNQPGRYHHDLQEPIFSFSGAFYDVVLKVRGRTTNVNATQKEFDGEILFTAPPSSGPNGANTVTLTVEAPGGIPVPGAAVTVKNENETATIGYAVSDANGQVIFLLDDGNYKALVSKPPLLSWSTTSVAVVGTTLQTISGAGQVINPPSQPEYCNVVLYSVQPTVPGAVTFVAHANQSVDNMLIDVTPVVADAEEGFYIVSLVRKAIYTLNSARYFGTVMTFEVPNQSTVDLLTILRGLREIEQ